VGHAAQVVAKQALAEQVAERLPHAAAGPRAAHLKEVAAEERCVEPALVRLAAEVAARPGRRWVRAAAEPRAALQSARCVEQAVEAVVEGAVALARAAEGVPQVVAGAVQEAVAAGAFWRRAAARFVARQGAAIRARLPAPAGSGHRETGIRTKQAARQGSAESRHRPAATREWSSWKPSLMMGLNRPRRKVVLMPFLARHCCERRHHGKVRDRLHQ